MSDSPRTLLPRSSTQVERAFDKTAAKHIESIPVERIFEQWNPEKCPADLLSWLAWAVSVDDWNADWPEQVKRDVIAASMDVHRHKGSVHSVKRALSALKVVPEIEEWTANTQTKVPHSFVVSAFANETFASGQESVLDQQFYSLVEKQIMDNKPARSQFAIHVGAAFSNELGIANAMQGAQVKLHDATLVQEPIQAASHWMTMAAGAQIGELSRKKVQPEARPKLDPATMSFAALGQSAMLVQLSMEMVHD